MKILRIFALGLLPVIALALGFGLGVSYQERAMAGERARIEELFTLTGSGRTVQADPQKEVDLSLFWSVWRLLESKYVNPSDLKIDSMVYGAVSGMVDAVGDPYTLFMTPKETQSFDNAMSGTLEGIGAQLDQKDGKIIVVAPIKGSPAEKAGLKPNDVIIKVNDKDLTGMALDDVVTLIRGPKGTPVTLTVTRDGAKAPIPISVTREAIHIPSVESNVVTSSDKKIGVVTVNQFGDDTIQETRKALTAFPTDIKGVVLDLRFNGGGYLEGAVDMVSLFLPAGKVVTVDRRDAPPEEHRVTGQTMMPDIPLVVLINGGSASASEITAGALQDQKRATIIGTQSFGKGTVQEVVDLPGGAALRVTIAKWVTPAGHDIGKKGITPDIVVDRTEDDFKAGKDPQLDAAVKHLLEKK